MRYVLEGSVRKAGNRVRITGQLIDSATGAHLWADRYEGSLEDIFELQDQVTARRRRRDRTQAGRGGDRACQTQTDRQSRCLRLLSPGLWPSAMFWTRDSVEEALRLFYRAIELDPEFAARLRHWRRAAYVTRKSQGWIVDQECGESRNRRLALRVSSLAATMPRRSPGQAMRSSSFDRDDDTGAALVDEALSINPNFARLDGQQRLVSVFAGQA